MTIDAVATVNAVADGLRAVIPSLDLGVGLLHSDVEDLAQAAIDALTGLGAVMPDEAAKLRAEADDHLAEAASLAAAVQRLDATLADVLGLCRPTRADGILRNDGDRLKAIEARLTREVGA